MLGLMVLEALLVGAADVVGERLGRRLWRMLKRKLIAAGSRPKAKTRPRRKQARKPRAVRP